jgi:ribosome-binding protein aMBF1 (putative translation factor)
LISTSPDEAGGYRRGGARKRAPGASGAGSMIGFNLAIVAMVAGLVVVGWFIAGQHQELQASARALAAADKRLATLEDRSRLTDQTLSDSGQDTQQQIGFWESEIRKLWAVSNDRNKKWIEDNRKQVKAQADALASVQSTQRDLKSSISRAEDAATRQQGLEDQLTGLNMQMRQLLDTQRDLVDQVNAARQTVASLQAGLAGRVGENEQAVAAIDAYRLQVNSRLAAIERRLSVPDRRASAPDSTL